MEAAQKGDKVAMSTLYQEISPVILAFCRKRAGYLGIPEDTLQESLIAIHRNRHVYIPERSFNSWMFAIVRSKLIDQLRKRARIHRDYKELSEAVTHLGNTAYSGVISQSEQDSQEKLLERKEEIALMREAVAELPEKYREAITLVKIEGFSIKEAAKKVGVGESALKVRNHRAFQMLAAKLKRESNE